MVCSPITSFQTLESKETPTPGLPPCGRWSCNGRQNSPREENHLPGLPPCGRWSCNGRQYSPREANPRSVAPGFIYFAFVSEQALTDAK